jgi:hypothetical protein
MLSIAIISKDRPYALIECIEDLFKKIPNNIPILITDGSTDKKNIDTLIHYFSNDSLSKRVTIEHVDVKLGSQPMQRNICLSNCKTPYILFIDDDCFFNQKTCSELKYFISSESNHHVFGCRIIQGHEVDKRDYKDSMLPNFSKFFWARGEFNINIQERKMVEHIQGTFMCFNTESLRRIGGFNENLISGYAPFEDTYTVMEVAKSTNSKPIVDYSISVQHGQLPRLQGISRDLGMSRINAFAFARNGVITSKEFHGIISTLFCLPIVLVINSIRIIRPISKLGEVHVRVGAIFSFCYGVIVGLFTNNR